MMRSYKKAKSIGKRLFALLVCTVLLLAIPVSAALAANAASVTTVTAELRPYVTVTMDGVEKNFYNAQGEAVYPIFYAGTHYLPIRSIGELMNKNVNWDQSTLTVTLSGVRQEAAVTGTTAATAAAGKGQSVSVQFRPDFSIVVDGVNRTFVDAQGKTVYPALYNGSVYLPVRAIGELMGKSVTWYGDSYTIALSGSSFVTDADSFYPQGATGETVQGSGAVIDVETAKAKALAHAGVAADQAVFLKQKLERDDGRFVYEIEFYTTGGQEYDYEIDAYSGAVLAYDYDAEWSAGQNSGTGSGSYIGEEKAKSIALQKAGLNASQVSVIRCVLERDDNLWQYEVEFYAGSTEYDCEINAYTGAILSWKVESLYD